MTPEEQRARLSAVADDLNVPAQQLTRFFEVADDYISRMKAHRPDAPSSEFREAWEQLCRSLKTVDALVGLGSKHPLSDKLRYYFWHNHGSPETMESWLRMLPSPMLKLKARVPPGSRKMDGRKTVAARGAQNLLSVLKRRPTKSEGGEFYVLAAQLFSLGAMDGREVEPSSLKRACDASLRRTTA